MIVSPESGIDAILDARQESVAPAIVRERGVDVVQARGRPLGEKDRLRANLLARTGPRVGVFHDDAVAVALERAEQRAGANLRAFAGCQRGDRAVEFFARRRVRRTEREGVGLLHGRERQARRVEVHERARQVELGAKSGPQPRRADALRADHGIALQNDGGDARARRFAGSGAAGRTATDDQKLRRLHPRGGWRASTGLPIWFLQVMNWKG